MRGVVNSEVRNGGIHVLHDGVDAFYMLDQIHEPQKVVVPKFIADLIKELKLAEYTIGEIGACVYDYEEQKWIDDNEELFYRAFLDGYEIEQEKLYTVELFNGQPLVEVNNILHFSSDLAASNAHVSKDKLEKAGFGWVFDCSGVKVVEVE
ncbi:TPA: DUF1642 domain-containing protein [Streptococcus suis]|nr:DUF1642 domain-containing protein [Streptococcus suis]HEM5099544.1 DUF1642 domain-containing protein [Streptococcus suis]HEM5126394.1 DUF1642 domain-containing protein [Streptococcus suis]HEM5134516.1 DUF1642 domain-containing protein [Streptococcus suis]HEM5168652.1 DUF1642 domain-containing protein [Streptococcus suis]